MSLRKEKFVNLVMALIVFCLGVQTFVMVIDHQDMQITEYCIDHPDEFIEGELYVNCSDWLGDHPELVEMVMTEREEIDEQ